MKLLTGCAPSEGSENDPSVLFLSSAGGRLSLACRHLPLISASVITWPSSGVSLWLHMAFLYGHLSLGEGWLSISVTAVELGHVSKDPISK